MYIYIYVNLVLFASTTICCAERPATCSKETPPPRADNLSGLEMRARGAHAKKVRS